MDNQPYQMKLSELRTLVSQELVNVSGELKDITQLIKEYLDKTNTSSDKIISRNLLATGGRLDLLSANLLVLNKRIELIVQNYQGSKAENEAIASLQKDIPINTKGVSMIKDHYLQLVNIYGRTGKNTDKFKNFDCFKEDKHSLGSLDTLDASEEEVESKKPSKPKKRRWFCV
jgi:hypothetical protein